MAVRDPAGYDALADEARHSAQSAPPRHDAPGSSAQRLTAQAATTLPTLWDLLAGTDPQQPVQTAVLGPSAQATAPLPAAPTIWDLLQAQAKSTVAVNGQPGTTTIVADGAANAAPGTLWDLLRTGNPSRARSAPLTIADALRAGQPDIDPATGRPLRAPAKRPKSGPLLFFYTMGDALRKVGKAMHSSLKVSGTTNVGLHSEAIAGNQQTYKDQSYYGRPALGNGYNNTDLTIHGNVLGLVNFDTHYSNNLYGNPYDNRVALNYAGKHLKLDAGDINGSLNGNSLIEFSRSLKGIQMSTDIVHGVRITGLLSQTKAQSRTVKLPGNNGPGPYYIYAGQIVDGSVHVRVNNRDMVLDQDYTLDLFTGELTFKVGTIITYNDVIAVTFETYGYNQSPGLLSGVRAEVALLKHLRVGATMLTQTSSGAGQTQRTKTDQFQGYNSTITPYTLEFPVDMIVIRDAAGKVTSATPRYPITATVDGIPQVYGSTGDFIVDPNLPNRVFFSRPIPSTSIVKISYTPQSSTTTPGNRSVLGFDGLVPIGKLGNVVAEWATSKLGLSGQNQSGTAMQLRSDMQLLHNSLHWSWALKNIDPGFISIESPGFNTNEKGITSTIDYAVSNRLKLNLNFDRSRRPSYSYGTNSTTGGSQLASVTGLDNYLQLIGGASYTLTKGSQLTFTHNTMGTTFATGGNATYSTDAVGLSFSKKTLSGDLSLSRNQNGSIGTNFGTGVPSTTGQTASSNYNSSSIMERLNLRWRASDLFSLTGVLANSLISSVGSHTTNAQNMQFNTELHPLKHLTMRLGVQLQTSGGYSAYGGSSGGGTGLTGGSNTGIGYGNPFGGGGINSNLGGTGNYSGGITNPSLSSSLGAASFGSNTNGINASIDFQPFQALSLNFTFNKSKSAGDYQFNSNRSDLGLTASFTPSPRLTLTTAVSSQGVTYIGSTGGTTSNLVFFNVQARPLGKLVTNLGLQIMRTNGSQAGSTGVGTGVGTGLGTGIGTGLGGSSGTGFPGGLPGAYGSGGYPFAAGIGNINLNSYNIRLEYPVWKTNNLYLQMDSAKSTGYAGSDQFTFTSGIIFDLGNNLAFTLGWRDQSQTTAGTGVTGTTGSGVSNGLNYHVRSVDADLSMHF